MKAFALSAHAELWARHGVGHPLGDDFTGAQDIIPQALDEQTVLNAGLAIEERAGFTARPEKWW